MRQPCLEKDIVKEMVDGKEEDEDQQQDGWMASRNGLV